MKLKKIKNIFILILFICMSVFTSGAVAYDYGDAPDDYKTITSNPPRHASDSNGTNPTGPYFGQSVDYESAWTVGNLSSHPDANLDDITATDDEDGIIEVNGVPFDTNGSTPVLLIEGQVNTFKVVVSNVPIGGAWVKIWLDGLNGNINYGFDNNNSQVIYNAAVNSSGTIDVSFFLNILGNRGTTQGKTYLRMRTVSESNKNQINSTGGDAIDGEVEDYIVFISERDLDYGDLPNSYGTILGSDGARHLDVYLFGASTPLNGYLKIGAAKDYENDATVTPPGLGDDVTNIDDEDGVTLSDGSVFDKINITEDTTIKVNVNTGGYLGVWVDFNNNGVFDAPSEGIVQPVSAGDNNIVIPSSSFTFSPGSSTTEYIGVRVRFASEQAGVTSPTGLSIGGEVEDYYVNALEIIEDFNVNKYVEQTEGNNIWQETAERNIGTDVSYKIEI